MHFTQFPPEFQELQRELMSGHHNKLIIEMNNLGYRSISSAMEHLCTHCEILVEGMYTYEDKLALCSRIAKELEKRREPLHQTPIYITSAPQ